MSEGRRLPRWCVYTVQGHIYWPQKEALVEFGRWKLRAFPSTREFEPTLQIETVQNEIDFVTARTVCNQILSICSWCADAPAAVMDGFCGSTRAKPMPRTHNGGHLSGIVDHWPYNRTPLADDDARLALGLFREALWQEKNGSIPYAALGYFKILEIRQGGRGRAAWLRAHLNEAVEQDSSFGQPFRSLAELQGQAPDAYLYATCRLAVAHATKAPVINPDDAQQVRDLSACTPVLHNLVRIYIRDELGVSDSPWDD